jgi:hypothetical protein
MRTGVDVSSWRVSRIRFDPFFGGMTITSLKLDPEALKRATGNAAGGGAEGPARRLRLAPAVQLELVSGPEGSRREVLRASLPEQTREALLVLLARLIGAGAIEDEDEDGV